MWILKSADTTKTATVAKLLKEGFEPFWGYRTSKDGKPFVKMYFKKNTSSELMELKIEVDRSEIDKLMQDMIVMAGYVQDALKAVGDFYESKIPVELSPSEKLKEIHESLFVSPEDETENEEAQLPEADSNEPPAGDSYRVVNEVPEGVKQKSSLTEAQEKAIKGIREEHGNVTVFPVSKITGDVKVSNAEKIFIISSSGVVHTEVTQAKTSSV